MFVFNRSAFPVLLPLALLMAVVIWSNRSVPADTPSVGAAPIDRVATVAQALQPGQKGG
jgi:hypothetical protein